MVKVEVLMRVCLDGGELISFISVVDSFLGKKEDVGSIPTKRTTLKQLVIDFFSVV